jgi:hypothetical protein
MRECVLLDTLVHCGCEADGTLGGEFVWAVVGSQMKLVRVGSQLHVDMDIGSKRRVMKKIGSDDLEVGGIYRNKAGKLGMFCGWVHSAVAPKKKRGLWYELTRYGKEHGLDADYLNHYFYFKVTQSHSYVEATGEKETLPDDLVAQYRNRAVTRVLESVAHERSRTGYYGYNRHRPFNEAEYIQTFAESLTLTPHGEALVIPDQVKAYITVSA